MADKRQEFLDTLVKYRNRYGAFLRAECTTYEVILCENELLELAGIEPLSRDGATLQGIARSLDITRIEGGK